MSTDARTARQNEAGFFRPYAVGFVSASVCTDLEPGEAARRLNHEHPTGIDSPWSLSRSDQFADGTPHPCPCPDGEGRRHLLFHC